MTATEPTALSDDERSFVHQRTIRVLQMGVVPGGMAMTSCFAAAALAGEEITGSETLGALAAVSLSIGGTAYAIPMAFVMSARGRRPGLTSGYTVGLCGATIAALGMLLGFYPLLVAGMIGVGAGQAANQAARYAGADLANESNRANSIGRVMFASTAGSVLGPILSLAVASPLLEAAGAPEYTGSYLLGVVLFGLAVTSIHRWLRPDPLILAGQQESAAKFNPPSFGDIRFIFTRFRTAVGAIAMALGQAVMVGVMTVTSIHMRSGDQSRLMISLVISLHIVGMFAFSPWVGKLVDRIGSQLAIAAGSIQLFIGAEVASQTAAEHAPGHFIGLFLIGTGWSFTMIAGSTLLTAATPIERRVGVQTTADFSMTGMGALAGITAGLVVEQRSFGDLAHWAGFIAIALAAIASVSVVEKLRSRPAESTPQDASG